MRVSLIINQSNFNYKKLSVYQLWYKRELPNQSKGTNSSAWQKDTWQLAEILGRE